MLRRAGGDRSMSLWMAVNERVPVVNWVCIVAVRMRLSLQLCGKRLKFMR